VQSAKTLLSVSEIHGPGFALNPVRSSFPHQAHLVARRLLPGLLAAAFTFWGITALAAPASENGVSIEEIEAGFGGYFKVGQWAPLWVTIRSNEERQLSIVVDAPDPDDNLTSLPAIPVEVKAGVSARCEVSFRTGRMNSDIQVRIEDSSRRTLASRRLRIGNDGSEFHVGLRLDRPLWITLGSVDLANDSHAGDAAETGTASDSSREPRVVRFDSPRQLPEDWRALQSIDLLIFPTARHAGTAPLDQLSPESEAVIQKWVRGGGHLLVSVGSDAAAFQQSRLADWVRPIVVEGQMPVRQLSTLEAFAGQNAPLRFSGTVNCARLGRLPTANVIIRQGGSALPLAASVPFGFGRVTVIGVDIDSPPFLKWTALKSVIQKLASKSHSGRGTVRRQNQQLTHVGVTDLATQFQQTHEHFPAVQRPSYWWIMGLIVIYVAVIGPLDYVLVRRLLRRPELTWLTFPILAGLAFAAAVWEGGRRNERDLLINQFDLVDIDSAGNFLRARTWASLYSPEHRRFSVAVEPDPGNALGGTPAEHAPTQIQMGWVAPPENSVGGLYRSGAASFGGREYHFAPAAIRVEDLPVAHWSTKSVAAEWTEEFSTAVVDCRLEATGPGQLKGTIAHHLAAPLEDCLLVVGSWAYIPTNANATLHPNVAWQPTGGAARQRDLKALITGEQQTRRHKEGRFESEITTTTEIYDPLDRSRRQQVRILSFHQIAGGTEYTGLADAALRDLELSEIMQLGRGVLIGRLAAPAARVLVDGETSRPASRETWVRLVFPVLHPDRSVEKSIPRLGDQLPRPPSGNSP
jgi:hypothetical protein